MSTNKNSIVNVKDFFDRHNGLQRNNRYSISFSGLPTNLPTVTEDDFKVESVAMSARAIDSITDNLAGFGSGRAVPRSQRFVPGVLLNFPVTGDNFIINFFNSWFNLIYSGGRAKGNLTTPFVLSYYNDVVYNTSLAVKLLDLNGNMVKQFTFYEVYPLESLPIELTMSQPNKFVTYQVLMNYREFTLTGP